MAITHTAGITFSSNNGSPTVFSISQAADGEINLDVVIAAAASSFSVVCPITSSLVKSVLIYADAAMTVLTKNSGGTTVNTNQDEYRISGQRPRAGCRLRICVTSHYRGYSCECCVCRAKNPYCCWNANLRPAKPD